MQNQALRGKDKSGTDHHCRQLNDLAAKAEYYTVHEQQEEKCGISFAVVATAR
jgi:hypothetical protein